MTDGLYAVSSGKVNRRAPRGALHTMIDTIYLRTCGFDPSLWERYYFQTQIEEDAMVFGISLAAYTQIHVVISLIAIVSGLVVLLGMIGGKRLNALTILFLVTTALTSITGFGFPFEKLLPAHIIGGISLVVLAVAILARYKFGLSGAWRWIWVVTASLALYFNVFVLVVQGFLKVPALNALAPTQKEPPFAIAQLLVLIIFALLTALAVKRFRVENAAPGVLKQSA
jgi:hypothetical protein